MAFCEVATREWVFVGASNVITLIPLTNTLTGARMDLSGVTQVDVCIGGIDASSDDDPSLVSWEQQEIDGEDVWVILVQPGLIPTIPLGEQEMWVTVYDADNLEGLVVTHNFPIEVIDEC